MAIAQVQAVSNAVDVLSTSITTTTAACVAGNILILCLAVDKNHGTITPPTGFTVIESKAGGANNIGGIMAYKVATGGETSFQSTWVTAATCKPAQAVIEYSGMAVPDEISNQSNSGDTAVLSIATGAITTTTATTMVVAFGGVDSANVTGWASRAWSNSFTQITSAGTGGAPGISVASRALTTTQSGLQSTFTFSSATGDQAFTMIAAFTESGGGGGTTATPTFSPVAGSYGSTQNVTISCTSPSPSIYYTVDGSTPTTSSTPYTVPIAVSSTTTIKAIATSSGLATSAVGSALYTIGVGGSGTIARVQWARGLASAVSTRNATATFSSGATAGNLLLLSASFDKAATGASIPAGFTVIQDHWGSAEAGGLIAWKIAVGGETSFLVSETTTTAVSTPTVIVVEFSGTHATTPIGDSDESIHDTPGRSFASSAITTTSNGAAVVAAVCTDTSRTEFINGTWTNSFATIATTNANNSPAGIAGLAVGELFSQSLGASVSTTYTYNPSGSGTVEGGAMFIVELIPGDSLAAAATPTFSPVAGTYATTQNVTISCTTPSSTIYYTIDGSTPTTGSSVYSTPISVPSTTTIKAIAAASGFSNSAVATGTFTITSSSGAVLIQQAEAESTAFTGSITVTLSSGATAGNVIVLVVAFDKEQPGYTLPTGFTTIIDYFGVGNEAGGVIAYKVAAGGETALLTSLTTTTISKPTAWAAEYSGMDTASLIGATVKATSGASLVQTIASGSLTTTKTYGFCLAFATADSWITGGAWNSGSFNNSYSAIQYVGSVTTTTGKAPIAIGVKHTVSGANGATTFTTTQTADEMAIMVVEFATLTDGSGGGGGATTTVPWSVTGNVTSSSATVLIASDTASTPLALKIYEMPGDTLVTTTTPVAVTTYGSYHIAKIAVTGLNDNTRYKYVPNDGGGDITAGLGYFTTFPDGAANFKFCHYSCNNVVNNARLGTIAAKTPNLVMCIGDLHYLDTNSATESAYYAGMVDSYLASNAQLIYKNIAFDRVWDDHDFSGNDSHFGSTGKAASAGAFRKFTPHYTLPASTGHGIWHSFVCGRMRFIVMDTRSEKINTDVQHISAEQLEFVKDEITAAKLAGQVVCLASPGAWIGYNTSTLNNDGDLWPGTSTARAQRTEIATHIRQQQMNRSIFLISGDAHMLAADDGTNNIYGVGGGVNFRVFHGAALSQNGSYKGGPYSYDRRTNTSTGEANGQHATVTVTDTGGSTIGINWTGSYGASDTVWQSIDFTLNVPKVAKARAVVIG